MDATDLDLPTLAMLAGTEVSRYALARLSDAGYPGLRRSHGFVFQHLVAGEPTIGELAAALGITQQGASKQVRELEGLGYVERRTSTSDARSRTVRLTPHGWAAIEAGRQLQRELEAEVVAAVEGEATVAAAKRVLAATLGAVGALDRVATRSFEAPTD
jgi:DNA-binding MarR family transcriptional regulator